MKLFLRLLLLATLTGAGVRLGGATALPPIALALTLNDAMSDKVYRGWPLIIRADAVLTEESPGGVQLSRSALALALVSSTGGAQNWPVRLVGDLASAIRLNREQDSVRITWMLTSEQSAAISPGSYVGTLTWEGRKSPPLRFVVEEPPASLSAGEQVRRAQLRSEAALVQGDLDAALAATRPPEFTAEETIALLLQRARVHERRGDFQAMLQTTQQALAIFRRDSPGADHPPVLILKLQAQALAKLVTPPTGGFPKADLTRAPSPNPSPAPAPSTPRPGSAGAAGAPVPSTGPGVAPLPSGAKMGPPAPGTLVPASALDDLKVRADPAGQWAVTANAGSFQRNTYNYYTPAQATGEPNVVYPGYNPEAWCPAQQNTGEDWIELTFALPVRAAAARVRQTFNPGAIVKVEAITPDGTAHVWWQGTDPYQRPATREIAWFAVNVPPTSYQVSKIRLTLNLASGPG